MNEEDRDRMAAILEKMHYDRILQDSQLLISYANFMNFPDIRAAVEDILERMEAVKEELEGKYYKVEKEEAKEEEAKEVKEEVKKEEKREFRPASEAQINYIRRLQNRLGKEILSEAEIKALSISEASKWIDKFLKMLGRK